MIDKELQINIKPNVKRNQKVNVETLENEYVTTTLAQLKDEDDPKDILKSQAQRRPDKKRPVLLGTKKRCRKEC